MRLWVAFIVVVFLGCSGEPLVPAGEGEGEVVVGGEGEGEPPCTDAVCPQFIVAGVLKEWTGTTVIDGELVVYGGCVDGQASLVSTTGSIAASTDCQSIITTVSTDGELSPAVAVDIDDLIWVKATNDNNLGLFGYASTDRMSTYLQLDANGVEVDRQVHEGLCSWLINSGNELLFVCGNGRYFDLLRSDTDTPLRSWGDDENTRTVVLAPLNDERFAAFGIDTLHVDVMEMNGTVVAEIPTEPDEAMLPHDDGNVWIFQAGWALETTQLRRFRDDGTAIDSFQLPCNVHAATGSAPWWFTVVCNTPATFETSTGVVVVGEEPRGYLIREDELGTIAAVVEVTRGGWVALSDVHVVDDTVIVSVGVDIDTTLTAAPSMLLPERSTVWVGYRAQ